MSKARTLANLISDNAELADGQISVAEVVGAAPTASPTFTGNIDAGDNVKIRLGDSDDLQIYHDGSNSYITDTGTGNLRIKATSLRVQSASGNTYLNATNGGSVDIFHNNAQKLATTATGIDVTGSVTSDGLTVDAQTSVLQTAGSSPTLQFKGHAGTQDTIGEIQSGRAEFSGTNSFMRFKTNDGTSTKTRLNIDDGGDISFYDTDGTTASFVYDASAGTTFNEAGADRDFRVESDSYSSMLTVDAGANYVGIQNSGNLGGQLNIAGLTGIRGHKSSSYKTASMIRPTAFGYSVGTYAVTMLGDGNTQGTVSIGYDPSSNTSGSFSGTGGEMLFRGDMSFIQPNTSDNGFVEQIRMINQGGVTINEGGADLDFRVESDNQSNMLKVDAGNDSVAINRSNGSAPLHVSGDPNDTVAPEHAYAKFTAQGLDGLAFGSFASGTYASWIQSGYTSNTYSPDWNNGYAMLLNPAGGNVGIRDTAPQVDLHVGGGGHIRSDVIGGKIGWGSGASAQWYSYMESTDDGSQNVGLQFLTTTNAGTSHYQMLRMYPDSGSVFNPDRGGVIDFRVASGSNNHALFVDSGQDSINIGTSSTNPPNGARFRAINHDTYLEINHASGTSSGAVFMDFRYNQTNVGKITQNGTSQVLYVTTSDSRLKENIADADDAGSKIDAIQVRKYDWKVDGSHQKYGMIAQELLEVAPEAVSVSEDPDEMMGVDYSKLVPMLIKEIQSLRLRVADLES